MMRCPMAEETAGLKAILWPGGGSVLESSDQEARRPNPADEITRRVT